MPRELNKIFEYFKHIRMRPDEEQSVRASLVRFMDEHPVRRPYRAFKRTSRSLARPVIAGILIAAFGGATIAYAAEQALPGDILYSVKINVNENARRLLAFSPEEDARVEITLADRRLAEVEELVIRGRLTPQAEASVALGFEAHALRAQGIIKSISEDEARISLAAQIQTELESKFGAHESTLVKIKIKHAKAERQGKGASAKKGAEMEMATTAALSAQAPAPVLENISKTLKRRSDAASLVRLELEAALSLKKNGDLKEDATERRKDAVRALAEAERFIATLSRGEDRMRAEGRLRDARNIIASGETRFTAEGFGEALILFQNAIRIAHEAKMSAEMRFKLDLEDEEDEDESAETLEEDDVSEHSGGKSNGRNSQESSSSTPGTIEISIPRI